MNIYHELNKVIDYIEDNLENDIDYEKIARILGVNVYTAKKLFSLLCNNTIAEYIRKRRLTLSFYDLTVKNEKIIDVAFKYQYDNPTSFSRAFYKFYGVKPSKAKELKKGIKTFPRIVFKEEVTDSSDLTYNIISLDEFTLYGVGIKTTNDTIKEDAPRFFSECINKFNSHPDYGMVTYEDRYKSDRFEYWCLYKEKLTGLSKYVIPKSKWIVFIINSQEAKDIRRVSQKFYKTMFLNLQYNIRPLPELEYYHDGITEFLIPIED